MDLIPEEDRRARSLPDARQAKRLPARLSIWLAATLAFALAVAACGPSASPPKEVSLKFFMFEGPGWDKVAKDVVADYQKTHPSVKVEFEGGSNAVTYPKLVASKQATPNQPLYNIYMVNPETMAKGENDALWMPLDPKNMPNAQDIIQAYRRPQDRGIGMWVGLIGLMYNKDKVKTPPTSWQDLWATEAFRGRVVLYDYLWAYNGLAVAARLGGGSEDNIDPGFKVWSANVKQIHSLVTSTQQMKDLMVKGDAWLTGWFAGNQYVWATKEGAPFGFSVPKEGGVGFPLYVSVVAGTSPEQKLAAEEIINLMLSPKYQTLIAEATATAPANKKVQLSGDLAGEAAFKPETLEKAIQLDWGKMAARNQEWKDRWDREVKSKL